MTIVDIALGVLLAEAVLYAIKRVVQLVEHRRTHLIVERWQQVRGHVGD